MSQAMRGRTLSPEHREAIRTANTGKKRPPEQVERFKRTLRRRMKAGLIKPGCPWTREQREKQSETIKARHAEGRYVRTAIAAILEEPAHGEQHDREARIRAALARGKSPKEILISMWRAA
jgi:hypothetical protein